ncbi:MAG: hypothetical protein AAF735_03425 [Myxococcota bacterium]
MSSARATRCDRISRHAVWLLVTVSCASEVKDQQTDDLVVVPVVGLQLSIPRGWSMDGSAALQDPDRGGLALRLISTTAVTGSPRIDVVLDAHNDEGSDLDDMLQRSLADMADYERKGAITIQHIDRREVRVGPRRAYRIAHDYTMNTPDGPIAISQLATLLVLDGRGVAVTAGGRTELFHPQSGRIDKVLSNMQVVMPPAGMKAVKKDDSPSASEVVVDGAQQLLEPMVLDD